MTPLFILILAAQAEAQFQAGVALVRVDAQVTDQSGRVIKGLDRASFEILDNGAPQPIVSFEQTNAPLDLVLLLDVSGSMRPVMRQLAGESRNAISALHQNDRGAVMFFAAHSRLAQDLTSDFAQLMEAIGRASNDDSLGGGTSVNAAILDAVNYLSRQPDTNRRAILIVTDNEGLNVRCPNSEVIHALLESGTVLNAIIAGKNNRHPAIPSGTYVNPDYTEVDISPIAADSGGEFMKAGRNASALAPMIDRIRSRYSMTFASPHGEPNAYHQIGIKIANRPDAITYARKGYYAAP